MVNDIMVRKKHMSGNAMAFSKEGQEYETGNVVTMGRTGASPWGREFEKPTEDPKIGSAAGHIGRVRVDEP